MHTLVALPAFTDNTIWMLHDDARALVVDPGDGAPVHAALDARGLELAAILVTHHHADHIGGVDELRQRCSGAVFGPARERIPKPFVPLADGTPERMHASPQRLAALPADTRVCCTHEYTQSNLRFAAAVEPDNRDIPTRVAWCADERSHGRPTLPSTIALERRINPFLRTDQATVAASARMRRRGRSADARVRGAA